MANANFIVQNGISIGGTSGATITADPTTGAVAIAPAATAAVPNPTATVFTTAGTVTTVATTGGVASVSDLGAAANTSTTSGATTFANITMTGNLASNSTGYFTIPAGTSAQRPGTPAVGMMRYNSTITSFEGYYAGAWSSLGGVKSVDGKAYIIAERSAGANDDVVRVYSGDSGTSTQTAWFSTSNISILPTTTATSSTTGALQVAGGASVAGNLYVGGNLVVANLITVNQETVTTTEIIQGNIVAAATTTSTDVNTGALVVKGGAGIAGNVFTGGWLIPTANTSQNLGSTTAYWNNIYGLTFVGTSTTAKYADLAENYQADRAYMAGTVLMFGGSAEVTVADADTPAVAGVVSTNPAHLMNGGLSGTNVVPVALQGRVPCQVIGPVHKGDLMVSAGHGFAKVNNTPVVGTVIGKALQEVTFAGKAVIEVVVGRV
jgi:hypothetical protein